MCEYIKIGSYDHYFCVKCIMYQKLQKLLKIPKWHEFMKFEFSIPELEFLFSYETFWIENTKCLWFYPAKNQA